LFIEDIEVEVEDNRSKNKGTWLIMKAGNRK
jgi:hypothetical protein